MQIVQQKVYTSVGQSRGLFKEDTPHSSSQFKLKHRERDGRAAWEAGGAARRAARMHRNNHQLLSHCLTPPIPQGHLAEGPGPDEGQHGDHHENARQRWSGSAQKQNCQKWQKEPRPRSTSLLAKLGKPTGSKVATPSPSHPQKSGLGIRAHVLCASKRNG